MEALRLTTTWPVPHAAAAAVLPSGSVSWFGDQHRVFRLASISKVVSTWAVLVAVEEGIISLDQPLGQQGCTVRHLLSHAGGYPLDGTEPVSLPERTRIYSNTGIEMVAAALSAAAGMPFGQYLREAVLDPLGMTATTLNGSPASQLHGTVHDLVTFVLEVRSPQLVTRATAAQAATVQFPQLRGVVPGVGRFDPCPWGLGFEIRGDKQPHWTGNHNSPATFGHFGGAGTLLWVDPLPGVACVALTDRPFDQWAAEALRLWPGFSDAVLAEATSGEVGG